MRAKSAAHQLGTGGGRIDRGNGDRVARFERRERQGIGGLFWTLPRAMQAERAREMTRTFTIEQISSIIHMSVREVVALVESTP